MKNKLVVSALVLGFSFAPISAFADSLTTVQGGTPTYSCPENQQIVDTDKCAVPAHIEQRQETVPGSTTPALTRTVGGYQEIWFGSGPNWSNNLNADIRDFVVNPGYPWEGWPRYCKSDGVWHGWKSRPQGEWSAPDNPGFALYCPPGGGTTEFYCNSPAQLDGENCVTPSTIQTVNYEVPASVVPATISGSNGGSLVASVTGFLSPVWNFITDRLLPAIGLLVVLGIGVRLSIKAVRKYSKVA